MKKTTDANNDQPTTRFDLSWAYSVELPFGQYRGRSLGYVCTSNPNYILWLQAIAWAGSPLERGITAIIEHLQRNNEKMRPAPPAKQEAAQCRIRTSRGKNSASCGR